MHKYLTWNIKHEFFGLTDPLDLFFSFFGLFNGVCQLYIWKVVVSILLLRIGHANYAKPFPENQWSCVQTFYLSCLKINHYFSYDFFACTTGDQKDPLMSFSSYLAGWSDNVLIWKMKLGFNCVCFRDVYQGYWCVLNDLAVACFYLHWRELLDPRIVLLCM